MGMPGLVVGDGISMLYLLIAEDLARRAIFIIYHSSRRVLGKKVYRIGNMLAYRSLRRARIWLINSDLAFSCHVSHSNAKIAMLVRTVHYPPIFFTLSYVVRHSSY
jgi:hypothetical protein